MHTCLKARVHARKPLHKPQAALPRSRAPELDGRIELGLQRDLALPPLRRTGHAPRSVHGAAVAAMARELNSPIICRTTGAAWSPRSLGIHASQRARTGGATCRSASTQPKLSWNPAFTDCVGSCTSMAMATAEMTASPFQSRPHACPAAPQTGAAARQQRPARGGSRRVAASRRGASRRANSSSSGRSSGGRSCRGARSSDSGRDSGGGGHGWQ